MKINRYNLSKEEWDKMSPEERAEMSRKAWLKKHRKLTLYFTPEEFDQITRCSNGFPVSRFIRKKALNQSDSTMNIPRINLQAIAKSRQMLSNLVKIEKALKNVEDQEMRDLLKEKIHAIQNNISLIIKEIEG